MASKATTSVKKQLNQLARVGDFRSAEVPESRPEHYEGEWSLMRGIKAAAVLIVALTTLAGCTPSSPVPNPSAIASADQAAVAAIKWEGGAKDPKLDLKTPLRVNEPTVSMVEPGSGASISMGQLVTFDSMVVDGETGAVEGSTYGGATPNKLILAKSTANETMLGAMRTAKVGGKFLYVVPAPANDATAAPTDPLATPAPSASKVLAITIRSVENVPNAAEGTEKAPDPALPKLTFAADGTPSVVAPKSKPTDKLASSVLIEGSGPQVTDGQTVAVKYYGWLWDGKPFDAVWGVSAPEVVGVSTAISGWRKAIVGKKVGSRVLMVVPPAMAYGGAGQDSIPPDSTLIFLVDVLAAY